MIDLNKINKQDLQQDSVGDLLIKMDTVMGLFVFKVLSDQPTDLVNTFCFERQVQLRKQVGSLMDGTDITEPAMNKVYELFADWAGYYELVYRYGGYEGGDEHLDAVMRIIPKKGFVKPESWSDWFTENDIGAYQYYEGETDCYDTYDIECVSVPKYPDNPSKHAWCEWFINAEQVFTSY